MPPESEDGYAPGINRKDGRIHNQSVSGLKMPDTGTLLGMHIDSLHNVEPTNVDMKMHPGNVFESHALKISAAVSSALVLGVILAFGPVGRVSSDAHAATCTYYGLNAVLVNIRRDPGRPGGYMDVLERGDIACATQERRVGDLDWVYIENKVAKAGGRAEVGGWAKRKYFKSAPAPSGAGKPATKTDGPKKPAEGEQAFSPVQPVKPQKQQPKQQTDAVTAADVFRFDEPVPFGAFPVRGRTLEELAAREPLFSPIAELPAELWKRQCATCHKWNKERLCEQGKSYLKAARHILRHQHPYGGPYKLALMRWAKTGCQ